MAPPFQSRSARWRRAAVEGVEEAEDVEETGDAEGGPEGAVPCWFEYCAGALEIRDGGCGAAASSLLAAAIFEARTMQPMSRPAAGSASALRNFPVKPCSRATCPITCIKPHEIERAISSVGERPSGAT